MARSHFTFAELGDFLDPRPAPIADAEPLGRSVSIPFEELPSRLHELPPKHVPIRVAGTHLWADQALAFLESGGRSVSREAEGSPAQEAVLYRLWRPNAFLESILPNLPGQTAIDLACGNGREATALAAAGFRVEAYDWSVEALANGRELARRYLVPSSPLDVVPIDWLRVDLEAEGPPGREFDLAVSFRYLHRPLLAAAAEILNPRGSLVFETFTTLHRERHGKPRSDNFVLLPGEAAKLVPGLEVRLFDEGWRSDGSHTARLWATKP